MRLTGIDPQTPGHIQAIKEQAGNQFRPVKESPVVQIYKKSSRYSKNSPGLRGSSGIKRVIKQCKPDKALNP
jgi:hypothetical protein